MGWFYPGSGRSHSMGVAGVAEPVAVPAPEDRAGAPDVFGDTMKPETVFLGAEGVSAPHIVNFGISPGEGRQQWYQQMQSTVLPQLAAFKPDFIFICAGFDAHRKEDINHGYMALETVDYEWITRQLMKIANTHCDGRIVSALEGGYRLQGKAASVFARNVQAHVRVLSSGYAGGWDADAEATIATRMSAAADDKRDRASAGVGGTGAAAGEESGSSRRSKRRRGPAVDYAALERQLQEEEARQAALAKEGEEGSGSAALLG